MAFTIFDPRDRTTLLARLDRITPASPRHWGTLTPVGMLAHLSDAMRMALGELVIPPRRTPLALPPVRHAIIHWLPFPKGAPTAPELLARQGGDCAGEAAALRALVERFARTEQAPTSAVHPAFGHLCQRDWGVLVHKHMDHHLRQFGA